jgi:hypothetical protein
MAELGNDTSRAAKMMDKLERKAKEMNASLRKAGEGLGNVGQKMAMGVTAPIIGGITLATEGTREFRQDLGKLDAAFKTTGHGVETGRKLFADFYGIIGEDDTSIEAVNHLAQMTKNQKELADWTTIATGVYASFGDSLPLEGLTEAANETVKVGKVTGPLADALNWVGISEDEVNAKLEKMNSEQDRSAYLTDLLTGKYKKIATEYRNINGVVIDANQSQADLRMEMADLGNKLEPIMTKVVRAITKLVDAFNSMPEPMQDMIIKFGLIAAAIGPVLMAVGKAMVFFALFGDKLGLIAKTGQSAIGFFANFGSKLSGLIPIITGIIGSVARIILQFARFLGWPGLIITAIIGLISVFKRLYDTNEKFRNWADSIAFAVKNAFAQMVNFAAGKINKLIDLANKLPGIEMKPIQGVSYVEGNGHGTTAHWATGTNFHPGGLAWVGERGPELINLPRGSKVYNNQQSMAMANQSITIGGTVRVEGVNDMGQLVGVTKLIAKEIEQGDRRLAGRVRVMPSMA